MVSFNPDTEELIEQARRGDQAARQQLLMRHHARLRRMISMRLDRRLAARLDPSDVVQEVLLQAAQELSDYLQRLPLPYYPWLRQLAWERLVKLHRQHLRTQKRSAALEQVSILELPEESALELASRLVAPHSSPSRQLVRKELRERVLAALAQLEDSDRELLAMRYLEHLSVQEIAAVLATTEGAVRVRQLRALRRLRIQLSPDIQEHSP